MAEAATVDLDSMADMSYSSSSLQKLIILYQSLDALYHHGEHIQLLLGQTPSLEVRYWPRKEIENYLIIPSALERFVCKQESPDTLFGQKLIEKANQYLKESLPPKFYNDPLNNDYDGKGSDFLDKFFHEVPIKINKGDYCRIADVMDKSEIHPDIQEMLDDLQTAMQSVSLDRTEDEDG